MGLKFGRNYDLKVQTQSGSYITIQLPFTVQFDITKNTLTSANVCQLRIYNLSKVNRNQIRFNVSNYGELRTIVFVAGYQRDLAIVFTGNISQAWSVREGVDFITQIECFDGGFAFVNGYTDASFPAGSAQRSIMQSLMKNLPSVKPGTVGNYPGTLSRGNTYSGNTVGILGDLSGGGLFIDNGYANILNTNEYLPVQGSRTLINANSGLLGTPILEQSIARFDMLFEPKLNVGTAIQLESLTEGNFDGQYKVVGVKHKGMISESMGASVITTGEFMYFENLTPAVS